MTNVETSRRIHLHIYTLNDILVLDEEKRQITVSCQNNNHLGYVYCARDHVYYDN